MNNVSNRFGDSAPSVIRFFGANLPAKKKLRVALPILKGIGKNNVFDICMAVGISPDLHMGSLSDSELATLKQYIEKNITIEGRLMGERDANIKRLIAIGCYRGLMHKRGLPVRGQDTKRNARTRKGPRKSFSGKK